MPPARLSPIARIIVASSNSAWIVIVLVVLLGSLATVYTKQHFTMTSDTLELTSPDLPWRRSQAAFNDAFPQQKDLIVAVVEGRTLELAEQATAVLAAELSKRVDLSYSVRRPDGGPFFSREGLLFLPIASVTLLPALLTVARPTGQTEAIGFPGLAPLDRFLVNRRRVVLVIFGSAAMICLALLPKVRFDFNPLHLMNPKLGSVSTLLDLMSDPDSTPNTIEFLTPSLDAADKLARRLAALPEVSRVVTLRSFLPTDQSVAHGATGAPITLQEAAGMIVTAFVQAGIWSFLAITALLSLVLRRIGDVMLTLIPILLTGLLTLASCVLIGEVFALRPTVQRRTCRLRPGRSWPRLGRRRPQQGRVTRQRLHRRACALPFFP
jgi:hypothetical protein